MDFTTVININNSHQHLPGMKEISNIIAKNVTFFTKNFYSEHRGANMPKQVVESRDGTKIKPLRFNADLIQNHLTLDFCSYA
jgi:hypothetical protein